MFTFRGEPIANVPDESRLNVWAEAFGLKKRPASVAEFTDARTRDIESDGSASINVCPMLKFPMQKNDAMKLWGDNNMFATNIPSNGYNRFDAMVITRYLSMNLTDNWMSVLFNHDHDALKLLAQNNPSVFSQFEILHADDEEKEVKPATKPAEKKQEKPAEPKKKDEKKEEPKLIESSKKEEKKPEKKTKKSTQKQEKVEVVEAEIVPPDSKAGYSAKNITEESKKIEADEKAKEAEVVVEASVPSKEESKAEEKPAEEKHEEEPNFENVIDIKSFENPGIIKKNPELKDKSIDRLIRALHNIAKQDEKTGKLLWSCNLKVITTLYRGPSNFVVMDNVKHVAIWLKKDGKEEECNFYSGENYLKHVTEEYEEYLEQKKAEKAARKAEKNQQKKSA